MGIASGIAGRGSGETLANSTATPQTPAASTRTYIAGSAIKLQGNSTLKVGLVLRWEFWMTKTAAGTASSTIDVAVGTTGTVADTGRLAYTKPAGTAAVDEGKVVVTAVVQSIGATGVLVGECEVTHNGNTVGHMTIPIAVLNTSSVGFDMTAVTTIGLCITTGAADAITISGVTAEALIP